MKLLALLAVALSLLSATAADARHHHRHNNHIAVPMPKPRPEIPRRLDNGDTSEGRSRATETQVMGLAGRPTHPSYGAIAWWPSTSPWRADEAFSRAKWEIAQWP
jgi:hypothetical protein